jgi:hypothetical protein
LKHTMVGINSSPTWWFDFTVPLRFRPQSRNVTTA